MGMRGGKDVHGVEATDHTIKESFLGLIALLDCPVLIHLSCLRSVCNDCCLPHLFGIMTKEVVFKSIPSASHPYHHMLTLQQLELQIIINRIISNKLPCILFLVVLNIYL